MQQSFPFQRAKSLNLRMNLVEVVFQRLDDSPESPVVFNVPESRMIKALIGRDGPLSLETLENITGMYIVSNCVYSHGTNVGATVEAIAKDFE